MRRRPELPIHMNEKNQMFIKLEIDDDSRRGAAQRVRMNLHMLMEQEFKYEGLDLSKDLVLGTPEQNCDEFSSEACLIWEIMDETRTKHRRPRNRRSASSPKMVFASLVKNCNFLETDKKRVVMKKTVERLERSESFEPDPTRVTSEDYWLEAIELVRPDEGEAAILIASAITFIQNSEKLWDLASRCEHDDVGRSRVLRKGLDHIPDSVMLWEALLRRTKGEDARCLLSRAVECCPLHLDFWLAYARVETYDRAKKILNTAREKLPNEPSILVSIAKLEEAHGDNVTARKVIESGISSMQKQGLKIDRNTWMKEAKFAESAGSVETCRAIIRNTIGIGVEEEDRALTWVSEASSCQKHFDIETARAIYDHTLTAFSTEISLWLRAALLEKNHGTRESLDALLRIAVSYTPQAQVLWLMAAKEKLLAGDVPAARAILQEACAAIPNSEEIWLAAFKLEFENREPERARTLLAKARETAGTQRVWMKSAIVERELGNTREERTLLDQGLKLFPSFFKLWLMLGQLEERVGRLYQAKGAFEAGLTHCPNCIPLWLSLANLGEKMSGLCEAQGVLAMARERNPQNPQLWLAAVRSEYRHGSKQEADNLMETALQECPNSGILWAEHFNMVPIPQWGTKLIYAMTKCHEDQHVMATGAKIFWYKGKIEEARSQLKSVVTRAPDVGDFWAMCYKLELEHGDEESQKDVVRRCSEAEPKHGEKWQAISKAVENSHQPVEAILKKVVVALLKEESDMRIIYKS